MSYGQITKEERIKLESYLEAGLTQKDCASRLGRSAATISRELSRNRESNGTYHARHASRRAQRRRYVIPKKLVVDDALRNHVINRLFASWSPEQIAGRLARAQGKTVIHHDTIYQWIYEENRDMVIWLRRGKKRQWRRKHGTKKREQQRELRKKKWIHERPSIVEKRTRLGDWEGDTMISVRGEKERLLTYTERKSRYLIARKLDTGTSLDVWYATRSAFRAVPRQKRHTLTLDNGTEHAEYERTERDTTMTVYFAHPYSSWERGTNENTNGLLRGYFPKRSSFATITEQQLKRVVRELNHRPRKRLNYATPHEVFNNCT